MDHHTVAAIAIAGSCLDVLGSLYLAYDLLGGPHGPLRLLTRAVTYSILFGLGYGLGLGLLFGVASGLALGVTIAIELNRASKFQDHYSLRWEALFSAIRASAFGAALYPQVGLRFAILYGVLLTGGQVVAYSRGVRPSLTYTARGPSFTRMFVFSTLLRTVGYIVAALVCSALVQHVEHPWLFATRLGVVTGLVTGFGLAFSPHVEYYADHIPARRMGVLGVALMFCGFALQSLQYWLAVFDVRVT
jgi:putative flippase GtrA